MMVGTWVVVQGQGLFPPSGIPKRTFEIVSFPSLRYRPTHLGPTVRASLSDPSRTKRAVLNAYVRLGARGRACIQTNRVSFVVERRCHLITMYGVGVDELMSMTHWWRAGIVQTV